MSAEIRWYCEKHKSLYAEKNENVCDSNLAVSRAIGRNPHVGPARCGEKNRVMVAILRHGQDFKFQKRPELHRGGADA